MDEHDWLAQRFQEHRPHLRAVAYRMLGSLSEADDAVQEAWLRLSRSDAGDVENLRGWLTTVVARVSLNMLRSRRSRREEPVGVHMPEPIVSGEDGVDPEQQALLADSVGLALLVVLETLDPAERLAFVLHDTFGVPFDEIAPMVSRSPAAARQLASRARRRVQAAGGGGPGSRRRPRPPARGRRRVLHRRPRRRLRRARRDPRPRHRRAIRRRRHARRPSEGDPRRTRRGPRRAHQLAARPAHATGARQRSRRRDRV
jgi:RNA polymerase sigma factor (sigma-70 family)